MIINYIWSFATFLDVKLWLEIILSVGQKALKSFVKNFNIYTGGNTILPYFSNISVGYECYNKSNLCQKCSISESYFWPRNRILCPQILEYSPGRTLKRSSPSGNLNTSDYQIFLIRNKSEVSISFPVFPLPSNN